MNAKSLALSICLLCSMLFDPKALAQEKPRGLWTGAISVMGSELKILVTFTERADSLAATIDIPQQMALGLPLQNVSWRSPRIRFELKAGPGLAVFVGAARGDTIAGGFTQAGILGSFRLQRSSGAVRSAAPDHVELPPPYREDEVRFTSDSVTISGTLTLPFGKGPHPAVILITGSGAHNRDEELFGFKPFRVIADHLTQHGLAVLRCDDRGVGGSTGSKAGSTSADHASDVLASLRFLQGRAEVNARQIGLCGHSEGGMIAPLVATRSADVAFIVLIAGPAIPGDTLILYQLESLMRAGGAGDGEISRTLAEQRRAFSCVRTGRGWDSLAAYMKGEVAASMAKMNPAQRKSIPDSALFVTTNVETRLAAAQTPWFRYFISHDPVPALEQVQCPVLAIFGELDVQVPVSLNKEPMEKALGKGKSRDWKVEVIPGANHLFQKAITGYPSEYATLEKQFTPGFLDLMTEWIARRVAVPPAMGTPK